MASDDLTGLAFYDGGFTLAGTGVWLDPRRAVEFGFASDPLDDPRASRLVATTETAAFLRARRPWPTYLPTPYHRRFTIGDADVELVPSGTLPGGAQVIVLWRGLRVLYLRRILPERVGPGEPLETPAADAVLIDAPAGFDARACSSRADTLEALIAWVQTVIAREEIPVVLADRLPAAPVLVHRLSALGCEMRLHRAIYSVVRLCAKLGLLVPRAWELRGPPRVGQVVILPHAFGTPEGLARIPRARVACLHDGSAELPPDLAPHQEFRLAFAAGVTEIAAHVQRTGARAAFLAPDCPPALAGILRDLGVAHVHRAGPPEQLALGGS